ncbi:aldehyde dehydrogenase family protein [Shouchella patagoniensis]|uniref:aldehyde dehydrogenase family protein n=1 Tax=Shouchella patagoniensis TaxID=228576 RepID=UPI000995AE85|nr:aldehyde dehydrogenase family protein [Shouchella patagoniensis]
MEMFESIVTSYVNGEWIKGGSNRTYEITNPYDNSVLTTVSIASTEQTEQAFAAAKQAQKQWAKTSADERKAVLERASAYLETNRDEIVQVLSKETGGTQVKAAVEFGLALEVLHEAYHIVHAIDEVKEVPGHIEGKRNEIHRLPLGVISSITPFNFPFNLSMRTIAPAIALGNSVVHKPDIQVGMSGGVIIAKAFEHAGLPEGVLNMLLTDIEEIGDLMLTNPDSQLISFTGSTAVGRQIGAIAGRELKRVSLELGGNSPFIVLADANVDHAVDAAIFGKFIHQGQICMIINRMIVHESLHDVFVDKFVEKAKALPVGDPADPKTVIGPLVNEHQLEKALKMIEKAKEAGASVALEGKRIGNALSPYVFTEALNDSELAQTELFAPIATIIKASSDEEAVALANETDHGLSSAIFSTDTEKATELALSIDAGMTHINDQTVNDAPNIPFGGIKASGLGRFGNPWIVDEFTTMKWVSVQSKQRNYPF